MAGLNLGHPPPASVPELLDPLDGLGWNRSRTRAAPTPTNISTKLEPVTEMKGTSASPATARANRVFPVPGGPCISIPRDYVLVVACCLKAGKIGRCYLGPVPCIDGARE